MTITIPDDVSDRIVLYLKRLEEFLSVPNEIKFLRLRLSGQSHLTQIKYIDRDLCADEDWEVSTEVTQRYQKISELLDE